MKTKKRKLKTYWIIILYIIFMFLLLYISLQYKIININYNIIDITKLIIIILLYEATRKTTKELYKRIMKKMEDQE